MDQSQDSGTTKTSAPQESSVHFIPEITEEEDDKEVFSDELIVVY